MPSWETVIKNQIRSLEECLEEEWITSSSAAKKQIKDQLLCIMSIAKDKGDLVIKQRAEDIIRGQLMDV